MQNATFLKRVPKYEFLESDGLLKGRPTTKNKCSKLCSSLMPTYAQKFVREGRFLNPWGTAMTFQMPQVQHDNPCIVGGRWYSGNVSD